jgi:RND family efflux transporter MFP subunit
MTHKILNPALIFRQILAVTLCALLLACSGKNETPTSQANTNNPAGSAKSNAAAPAARSAGPAIAVTTVPVVSKDFPIVLQAIGSITSVSSVDVRAQVSSVLTSVHVKEGQFVKAGDLLFTLDSRADQAKVAQTLAQVAKDEASLADAKRQFARSKDLLAQNFISQGANDTSQAQLDAQLATVKADQAALEAARVSLSYARVVAPGAGRIGVINVYPGTTVQANLTSLATITQLDPIDVTFSVPQRHLADVLAALKTGSAPVTARLPEGKSSLTGRLNFVDNSVDLATGTVKVKARYANKENLLWPGAFVNVTLTASVLKNVTVIPVSTIIETTKGKIVYLNDKGKAALRPVNVLATQGDEAAVTGVQSGDLVVLEGRQNLRPDSALVERKDEGSAKPAGAASKPAANTSAPTKGSS